MATTREDEMKKSHEAGQQSISKVAEEGTDLAPGVSGGSPAGKLEEMTLKELRQSTARGIPLVRGPGEKRAAFKEAVVGGRAHTEEGKKAGAEFIAAQEAKGAAKKAKKAGRQVLRGKGGTAMFRDAAKSAAASAMAAGEAVTKAAAPKTKAPAPKGETPEQHLKGIEKGIRETSPRVSDAPTGFADTGEELVDQMLAEEAATSPLETEEAFADPSSPLDEPEYHSRDFTDSPVLDDVELAGKIGAIMGNPSDGTPILDTLVDRSTMTFPVERLRSAVVAGRIRQQDANTIGELLKQAGYLPTRRGQLV